MSFEQYPELKEEFDALCRTRRNEILQSMVDSDSKYSVLRRKRSKYSMLLNVILGDKSDFLEKYTDAVYAQECYELDALYRRGILDALEVLTERGLL